MAPTPVQRVGKSTTGTTIAIGAGDGWAAPTAGNLLVCSANSDALVTGPSGAGTWIPGPSIVDGNAAYSWYKFATGTETSITFTPSVSDTITVTACEYSGVAAFDTSNSSTITAVSGNQTNAASVTTAQPGDLVIAIALLHGTLGGTIAAPTGPSWSNSFVNVLSPGTGGSTDADTYTYLAELVVGAAGSYSTVCTWTNNRADRQHIILAFTASTDTPAAPAPFVLPQDLLFELVERIQQNRGPGAAGQASSTSLAGSVTPTGALSLATSKAHTGAVTPTGALAKAISKPGLVGSSTPTGALARQTNKALAGSSTPTGVLTAVKVVLRSFAGSSTPTGALTKQISKALAGSSTPTGALAKQVGKALTGSVTATGALAKAVSKALVGRVTPTGVLSTTRVVLRSFAGAVTPTGALARQTNKALVGSSTPRGALARAISKALAGAVTAAGALAKQIAKPFAGSSTPTSSLSAVIPAAVQNATSDPAIVEGRTSTPAVTANRTSTPGITARRTSSPNVSDDG